MAERGLMLSEEKTKVTHVSEGFDFLGFNIREYKSNGKLLTKPSKDAMKNFCDKVRTKIKSNKSAKASLTHKDAQPHDSRMDKLLPLRGIIESILTCGL